MMNVNFDELRNVPANFKYYRESLGLNYTDTAKLIGFDVSYPRKIENAERFDMRLSTALAICKAFQITLDDLLYRNPEDGGGG